ncbi:unnamed protein product, partial [Prorocentrum cordatum]
HRQLRRRPRVPDGHPRGAGGAAAGGLHGRPRGRAVAAARCGRGAPRPRPPGRPRGRGRGRAGAARRRAAPAAGEARQSNDRQYFCTARVVPTEVMASHDDEPLLRLDGGFPSFSASWGPSPGLGAVRKRFGTKSPSRGMGRDLWGRRDEKNIT